MDLTDKMLDILVGIFIFVALFGVILTGVNGFDWANVNAGGTIVDFSWAPYLLVLLVVLGLVYYVIKNVKKN